MILVDANLLIYAIFRDAPQHEVAHEWLEETLAGNERVALPWEVLCAFIRIATNPRLMSAPLTLEEALGHVEEWLDLPVVQIIGPTEGHRRAFARLLRNAQAAGNLVTDAHLAALAMEHGSRLASNDGDFARFHGLDWFSPLDGKQ